ncbi:MAG: FCD domain-containing protein [Ornithinimicrobium sp.]|uniref:FCD domain-containing protein n=1 Tax=Ornithinimicrobium sp. TaxID=1977084 RepID=UPI003D9AD481
MPDVKEMAYIMNARLLIEPQLAELAYAPGDDGLLDAVDEAIEEQTRAPHSPDPAAIREYHRADETVPPVDRRAC